MMHEYLSHDGASFDVRVPSEAVLTVTSFVHLGLKLAVVVDILGCELSYLATTTSSTFL